MPGNCVLGMYKLIGGQCLQRFSHPHCILSSIFGRFQQAYSFKRLIKRSDDILKEMADQQTVEYLIPDKEEIDPEPQLLDSSIIMYEEEAIEPDSYVTLKIEPDTESGADGGDEELLPRWMTKPMPETSDSTLSCCMCSEVFDDDISLKVHCSTEHDVDPNAEPPRKRNMKYACRICNQKVFACLGQLQKHQKAFAKTICSMCGLSFLQSKLQKHMVLKHGPKKPIEHVLCQICNTYVRTTQFSVHRKAHVGELKYECDVCGKKFRVRNYLKMHLERHFPSLRPPKAMKVACAECGKQFVHPSKLMQHAIIHTDAKVGF
jgi:Zinc finger, C2H2 type